jgi:glycerol-3-phosphate responsive antiterminator
MGIASARLLKHVIVRAARQPEQMDAKQMLELRLVDGLSEDEVASQFCFTWSDLAGDGIGATTSRRQ